MNAQRPGGMLGLKHLALFVIHLEECVAFYRDLLGMKVVWQPDPDNYYLSSGEDNLALHRAPEDFRPHPSQQLDHLGFLLRKQEDVFAWHEFLQAAGVSISKAPRVHRDGACSFYCKDPEGNSVQMIHLGC